MKGKTETSVIFHLFTSIYRFPSKDIYYSVAPSPFWKFIDLPLNTHPMTTIMRNKLDLVFKYKKYRNSFKNTGGYHI